MYSPYDATIRAEAKAEKELIKCIYGCSKNNDTDGEPELQSAYIPIELDLDSEEKDDKP